jgi:DNA replication protein DnaC
LNPGDSANPNTTKKSLFFCKDITCNRLILDELGFLPIDKRGSDLLFQVASARYETGAMVIPGLPRALAGQARPIIRRTSGTKFSTTIPPLACGRAGLAAALADRVLHHCEVVVIEGQSYRVKNNKSQS